jgi:hypothetical protein
MGQYNHPVCIEAEEGLNPHGMDCGRLRIPRFRPVVQEGLGAGASRIRTLGPTPSLAGRHTARIE